MLAPDYGCKPTEGGPQVVLTSAQTREQNLGAE
jgi:hypothetical protein